ncbi:hypothetical protein BB560_006783 [Smittium megazygosporum]|uniref:HCP-like protein n=1 Tax=Smittium megazygosporum TaxID=133381 RepID=A0A2T9Y1L9_9FUNG|nr:hypothetical protein BB560_006783 [Smittium megazygosporum]
MQFFKKKLGVQSKRDKYPLGTGSGLRQNPPNSMPNSSTKIASTFEVTSVKKVTDPNFLNKLNLLPPESISYFPGSAPKDLSFSNSKDPNLKLPNGLPPEFISAGTSKSSLLKSSVDMNRKPKNPSLSHLKKKSRFSKIFKSNMKKTSTSLPINLVSPNKLSIPSNPPSPLLKPSLKHTTSAKKNHTSNYKLSSSTKASPTFRNITVPTKIHSFHLFENSSSLASKLHYQDAPNRTDNKGYTPDPEYYNDDSDLDAASYHSIESLVSDPFLISAPNFNTFSLNSRPSESHESDYRALPNSKTAQNSTDEQRFSKNSNYPSLSHPNHSPTKKYSSLNGENAQLRLNHASENNTDNEAAFRLTFDHSSTTQSSSRPLRSSENKNVSEFSNHKTSLTLENSPMVYKNYSYNDFPPSFLQILRQQNKINDGETSSSNVSFSGERKHEKSLSLNDTSSVGYLARNNSRSKQMKKTLLPAKRSIYNANVKSEAYFFKGCAYFDSQEYSKAARYFKRSASLLNPSGLLFYGLCLRHGWGVPQNMPTSFIYFQQAAKIIIDPQARAYERSIQPELLDPTDMDQALHTQSVSKNEEKAEKTTGLEQGDGQSYCYGWGVPKNFKTANKYFALAVHNKYPQAYEALAISYEYGRGVKKSRKKAAYYFRKAEELGISYFGNSWIYKEKFMK